jgi:hypothetical protein
MSGTSSNSHRSTGSNGSSTEPADEREYRGGSAASTYLATVRQFIPSRRAISDFETPSAASART